MRISKSTSLLCAGVTVIHKNLLENVDFLLCRDWTVSFGEEAKEKVIASLRLENKRDTQHSRVEGSRWSICYQVSILYYKHSSIPSFHWWSHVKEFYAPLSDLGLVPGSLFLYHLVTVKDQTEYLRTVEAVEEG